MADIASIEIYMIRDGTSSDTAYVYFMEEDETPIATSQGVSLSSVSNVTPEWITFTFSPAATISVDGWYRVRVGTPGSPSGSTRFRVYKATDWQEQSFPLAADKENSAQAFKTGSGWTNITSIAYRINGDVTNVAETPGIKADFSNNANGYKFEAALVGVTSTPSKPTNPDPADDATDVDFSDLTLDWDDGGGADTFDVYVGDAADNLTLIVSGTALTTRTLTSTQRDDLFTDHCYWRVDATNEQGTTTGDVWDFTVAGPGKAKTPAPIDDEEGVYIHGIDKITELSWVNPDGEYPEYHVYFKYPGDEDWNDFGATGLTRYYTIDNDMRELLDYFSIYQWRIDTYDPVSELTTTGDTWTFISDKSHSFTTYSRRSDYDPDKVWEPGTGWVDINSFEYTGGGRYKGRLVAIGHNCIYFGSL